MRIARNSLDVMILYLALPMAGINNWCAGMLLSAAIFALFGQFREHETLGSLTRCMLNIMALTGLFLSIISRSEAISCKKSSSQSRRCEISCTTACRRSPRKVPLQRIRYRDHSRQCLSLTGADEGARHHSKAHRQARRRACAPRAVHLGRGQGERCPD